MLNHYLLHTFTTHFPFSRNTNFSKIKPLLHFLKTDYPKLKNPLGNIRSISFVIKWLFSENCITDFIHFIDNYSYDVTYQNVNI